MLTMWRHFTNGPMLSKVSPLSYLMHSQFFKSYQPFWHLLSSTQRNCMRLSLRIICTTGLQRRSVFKREITLYAIQLYSLIWFLIVLLTSSSALFLKWCLEDADNSKVWRWISGIYKCQSSFGRVWNLCRYAICMHLSYGYMARSPEACQGGDWSSYWAWQVARVWRLCEPPLYTLLHQRDPPLVPYCRQWCTSCNHRRRLVHGI